MKPINIPLGSRVFSPPWWALLLALVGMAFFCRLGFWQLGRADEKAVMTQRYEQRLHLPAQSLPELLARGEDVEDFPLHLEGRYDNTGLVYLEQMQGPKAGFHVYTLFIPAGAQPGAGQGVLVNRGWVPADADMQKLPAVPPAMATGITGTVAMPSPYFTVGEPDYTQKPLRVARLEMPQISAALGVQLRPFFMRLDASEPDGFVRDWTPGARLGMPPEKHRAYAFQWFSLALAVFGVLLAVNLQRRHQPDNESRPDD